MLKLFMGFQWERIKHTNLLYLVAKQERSEWVPVKIINTVDLGGGIHSKRHSIQATAANHT